MLSYHHEIAKGLCPGLSPEDHGESETVCAPKDHVRHVWNPDLRQAFY